MERFIDAFLNFLDDNGFRNHLCLKCFQPYEVSTTPKPVTVDIMIKLCLIQTLFLSFIIVLSLRYFRQNVY